MDEKKVISRQSQKDVVYALIWYKKGRNALCLSLRQLHLETGYSYYRLRNWFETETAFYTNDFWVFKLSTNGKDKS